MRRGFTLVELMVSSVILIIVSTAFVSAVMGGTTLVRQAYNEAESSILMRELRDRLLFRAAPPSSDCCWSGLISATNATNKAVVQSNTKVIGYSAAIRKPPTSGVVVTGSDLVSQEQRIMVSGTGNKRKLVNAASTSSNKTWLCPGNLNLLTLPDDVAVFSDSGVGEGCYTIRLGFDNGRGFKRMERIIVPVFSHQQLSNGGAGTYNNGGTL